MPRPPLVALEDVDVTLGGARVLAGVTLAVGAGEGVALVGPNGSGKSTLLRVLRGELWPDPRGPGRRLFALDGEAPSPSPIGARARIALVSPEAQDAYARRGWDLPVEAVIRSGFFDALWPEAPATSAQAARIAAVAERLGIAALLGRSMTTLSRGEGRRVLLARALAPGPAMLLLDEVCDGLDAAARERILGDVEAVLRDGVAVVMATHREEELVAGLSRMARIEGGRIREDGFRVPADEHEHEHEHEDEHGSRIAADEPEHEPEHERGPVAFALSNVWVELDGAVILRDLSLTLPLGESLAIVGANGAGKSTLLRLLAGEEHPRAGTIRRLDLPPDAGLEAIRRRLALVSPDLHARAWNGAPARDVAASGFAGSIGLAAEPSPAERAAADAALAAAGAGALADRAFETLSYGEQRRVLLARALAPGPDVLLLDEPAAGLDAPARAAMRATLTALARGGRTVVLVTHHDDEIPAAFGRRLALARGRLAPPA